MINDVKKFEKIYQRENNKWFDYEDAMNTARDDYGPYLAGADLIFVGAYVRTMWTAPEKITDEIRGCLQRTINRAKKYAKMRAYFRI